MVIKSMVGEHIFFPLNGNVCEATILDVNLMKDMWGNTHTFADVRMNPVRVNGIKSVEIFRTREECLASIKETSEKIVEEYKNSIKDVNDLIKFMLTHVVTHVPYAKEYTDQEARKAALERAEELGFLENVEELGFKCI